MRFCLTSFFILFALVKLVEWARSLEVPFSVFVVAGLLLAIASNYDKRNLFPFWADIIAAHPLSANPRASSSATSESLTSAEAEPEPSPLIASTVETASIATRPEVELPPFNQ